MMYFDMVNHHLFDCDGLDGSRGGDDDDGHEDLEFVREVDGRTFMSI